MQQKNEKIIFPVPTDSKKDILIKKKHSKKIYKDPVFYINLIFFCTRLLFTNRFSGVCPLLEIMLQLLLSSYVVLKNPAVHACLKEGFNNTKILLWKKESLLVDSSHINKQTHFPNDVTFKTQSNLTRKKAGI